jgi:hypothetical protein
MEPLGGKVGELVGGVVAVESSVGVAVGAAVAVVASATSSIRRTSLGLTKARAEGSGGRPLKGTGGWLPAKPAVDLPSVCCSTGTGGTAAVSFTSGQASSSSCPAPNRS